MKAGPARGGGSPARDRQKENMRLQGSTIIAFALVAFSSAAVGGIPEAAQVQQHLQLDHRALQKSNDSRQEQSVLGALTDVFTTFGDLATVLYKVTLTTDKNEGRGKGGKMAIPLIIGFKISGVIVAAIVALKVLVLKTMAMSSLALLASAGVAGKYIYDKVQHKKQEAHQATPYYYGVQEMAWDPSSYDVAAAHTDLSAVHQPIVDTDQLGHYSNQVLQTAVVNPGGNQTSYTYIPGVPVAQRKILRGSAPYKVKVYKTVHRMSK